MSDARGAALVEAVLLSLILLIPVAWGLTIMDRVQRAALASAAAVREAGDVATSLLARDHTDSLIDSAVSAAFHDQDLAPGNARVRWSAPAGVRRGGRVEIEVLYQVEVFGGWLPFASIPIRARHMTFFPPYASRDA